MHIDMLSTCSTVYLCFEFLQIRFQMISSSNCIKKMHVIELIQFLSVILHIMHIGKLLDLMHSVEFYAKTAYLLKDCMEYLSCYPKMQKFFDCTLWLMWKSVCVEVIFDCMI